MKSLQKNKPVPVLGKQLEETKFIFLKHLESLGLYSQINAHARSTAPIVTYPVAKLTIHDLSSVSDPNNPYVGDRLDTLWDLFDILSRMDRSSEQELRDLRARLIRIEHILLKKMG